MTTHIRPTDAESVPSNGGGFAPGATSGAVPADVQQATNDNADRTYMASGAPPSHIVMPFGSTPLAATQRCLAVRGIIRASSVPGDAVTYTIGNLGVGGHPDAFTFPAEVPGIAAGGAIVDLTGGWHNSWRNPSGPPEEWTQTHINDLQMNLGVTSSATRIYELTLDLDIRTQPLVSIDTVTDTDQHWPFIDWTATPNDGDTQEAYVVHIYDLNVNPTPTFTDTLGLAYASGIVSSTSTAHRVLVGADGGIPDGDYRVMVEIAKDFNGANWWSLPDSADFSIGVTPDTPTAFKVIAGTLDTNTPKFQTYVVGPSLGSVTLPAKAEFELASDSGYTTNVRQFVADDDQLTTKGIVVGQLPASMAINAGTWFARARTYDRYGSVSGWTSNITFDIVHPPTTLDYNPTGGTSVAYDTTIPFTWTFFDKASDDKQSAYQVVVVDPAGGTIIDTGKTTSLISEADLAIPIVYKDQVLRWKVKVWDTDDTPSADFSAYQAFVVSDVPGVTITVPFDNGTVATPAPEIDWIFGASSSRYQIAFRIEVSELIDGSYMPIYDSFWTPGDDATFTLPTPAMIDNGATYTITVSVRDNTRLEDSATITVTTSWIPPDGPLFTVDTSGYDDNGYVEIDWDADLKDSEWYAWRVYRRRDDLVTYELLIETQDDIFDYQFFDFLAPANTDSNWVVVQVALRFGSQVESDRFGLEVFDNPGGTKYWIISEDSRFDSIRLDICTQDEPVEEYEVGEMLIYGMGRKIDQGTRWGYRSELVARLLDNDRASSREARLSINNLRFSKTAVWVRSPFGDVIKAQIGDTKFSRDAGRGIIESGTMTIPYAEIY